MEKDWTEPVWLPAGVKATVLCFIRRKHQLQRPSRQKISWCFHLSFVCLALVTYSISLQIVGAVDVLHEENELKSIREDGDIIIGGLFPMHEDGIRADRHCGAIMADKGIQRMEAMLYAVDEINRKQKLLPGIKLGVYIRDTCSQETHALEQTLEFIKTSMSTDYSQQYVCSDGTIPSYSQPKPIAGVIGAAASKVSMMVANILGLFKMPQISYSSTTVDLSDKAKYNFFSRVVPPDNIQAKAMVDIVERMGWEYVSAIADGDSYGEKGIESFRKHAGKRGICIAGSEKVMPNFQEEDYLKLVERLAFGKDSRLAHAVVMFVSEVTKIDHLMTGASKILGAVKKLNLTDHFAWVASDSWGDKRDAINLYPEAAVGAITIRPTRHPHEAFDKYFKNLTASNNQRNVWFEEYLANFNCSLTNEECYKREIEQTYRQESYVPFVIDAVNLLATALGRMVRDKCSTFEHFTKCSLYKGFDSQDLLRYIRTTSYLDVRGTHNQLDLNGDNPKGMYDIFQFRRTKDNNYGYVHIGQWNEELIEFNATDVANAYQDGLPSSMCGEPCGVGQFAKTQPGSCCGWVCVSCSDMQYVENNTCNECGVGMKPNAKQTSCELITIEAMEWNSLWSVIPAVFSALGICLTIFVTVVFLKFNATPIIMASGRELCYMMLLGILLSYSVTFVLISRPNDFTCGLLRVKLGISLCICYSAILTKTNRLARIFTSDIKSVQRPRFISPRSQIVICSLLVSVQLIGAVIWILVTPPEAIVSYPDRKRAILTCAFTAATTASPLILSQVYNMILIACCTVLAIRTRKIPENFNETKHIGFTMYSTCIVWLAFVPIYFGTMNDFRIQTTSLALCISICATVCLCLFFGPKVYIVLIQPHKNVRQGTQLTNFQKMQIQLLQQQMRFMRSAIIPPTLPSTTTTTNKVATDDFSLTSVGSGAGGGGGGAMSNFMVSMEKNICRSQQMSLPYHSHHHHHNGELKLRTKSQMVRKTPTHINCTQRSLSKPDLPSICTPNNHNLISFQNSFNNATGIIEELLKLNKSTSSPAKELKSVETNTDLFLYDNDSFHLDSQQQLPTSSSRDDDVAKQRRRHEDLMSFVENSGLWQKPGRSRTFTQNAMEDEQNYLLLQPDLSEPTRLHSLLSSYEHQAEQGEASTSGFALAKNSFAIGGFFPKNSNSAANKVKVELLLSEIINQEGTIV